MQLTLTSEQNELRAAVRRLLCVEATSAKIRTAMESDTGYDATLWRRLGEMGALGLPVPESRGGAGAGHVDRAVVAEELGRALAPSPFLASAVFAVDTLLALDDASDDLLPALATGDTIGAVAVAEPGHGGFDPTATATHARRGDDGWVLSGTKTPVVAGDAAHVILVYAGTDHAPAFFRVAADAPGVTRTPLKTLDPTRRLSRIDFDDAPATRIDGDARAALEAVTDLGTVALGAEQVGGLERAMELTVDYAKIRVQFGRPIGSYQAVKHTCADMYCTWEQAYSAVRFASWAADHDRAELPVAAAILRVYVGPGYFDVAKGMVVCHGGVGYTWEHDAHLFYKRAKADELLLGTPGQHRARLADLIRL